MLCTWQNDCLYVHVVSYTRKHDMKRGSKHRYEHVSIHVQHIFYGRSKPLPMVRDTVVAITWAGTFVVWRITCFCTRDFNNMFGACRKVCVTCLRRVICSVSGNALGFVCRRAEAKYKRRKMNAFYIRVFKVTERYFIM